MAIDVSAALKPLTDRLSRMQAEIEQLKRNQRMPQLGNASIDNGALTVNDSDGNPALILGAQPDGTFAVTGSGDSTPPSPSDPTLVPGIGEISASWDGLLTDGTAPLADFLALQVHVSVTVNFTPDQTTLQGVLHGAGNFRIGNLVAGTTYAVCFVVINNAGNESEPSDYAQATPGNVAGGIEPGDLPGDRIQAGTVEATQLVDGITVPGIVDATTITGAQFVATGTAGEIRVYDGPPALGNLVASVNAQPFFTDPQGNSVGVGVFAYASPTQLAALQGGDVLIQNGSFPWAISVDNATQSVFIQLPHTGQGVAIGVTGLSPILGTLGLTSPEVTDSLLLDAVSTPAAPGSGVKVYSNSSGVLAIRGTDGNVYLAGRRTIAFTSTQTVSSATFTTVTDGTNNFSANVVAAAYKFRAVIVYEPSGTTGNANFELTSPAASSCGATFRFDFNGMSSGVARYDIASGFGNAQVGPTNLAIGTTVFCTLVIEGTAVFSASGVLAVKAETAGGSNFVIQQGSYFELEPL